MTVQTSGAAVAKGSGTIASIIVGGGYESDNDDSTYVESVMRKSGTSSVVGTKGYFWDYTADSALRQDVTVRVRVTLIDATFVDAFTVGGFEVQIARASDGLVLTGLAALNGIENLPLNVPTWFEKQITMDTGEWDALRTGSWTGYGPTQLAVGWGGSPGFPSGAIGDEARIRVHEMEIVSVPLPPGPPTPGYWGVQSVGIIPPSSWTTFDLSTAQFGLDTVSGQPWGKYDPAANGGAGAIITNLTNSNGTLAYPDFWFPDFVVSPTQNYELEFTFDRSDRGELINAALMATPDQTGYNAAHWNHLIVDGTLPDEPGGLVRTVRIGPAGVEPNPEDSWWAADGAANYVTETYAGNLYPLFETQSGVEVRQIRMRLV